MKTWIYTLIEEKGLDLEHIIEIDGCFGINYIPLGVVIEHILIAPLHEKTAIKKMLIKIDFINGNILDFFKHLAKAIIK